MSGVGGSSDQIRTLLDKQELHELLARLASAFDRYDIRSLRSLFDADATVDYGFFAGAATKACDLFEESGSVLLRCLHSMSNELFTVDGDHATGQSYVVALVTERAEGGAVDRVVAGRYLDRFVRRDGRWLVSYRSFVLDWTTSQPSLVEPLAPGAKPAPGVGTRDLNDPVYAFMK